MPYIRGGGGAGGEGGASLTMGAVGAVPNANAGTISSDVLVLQPASAAFAGLMLAADFSKLAAISGTNTGNVTLSTANGLSLVGQALSMDLAGAASTGTVSTSAQTFAGVKTFSSVPVAAGLTAPASTAVTFTSNVTDSGTNTAFTLNSGGALTGSTKLLSIQNNGTEHLSLNRAGVLRIMQTTGSISAPSYGDIQGVARIVVNMFTANDGIDYKGRADGTLSTAVSHKFGSTTALSHASAKIAGFYNDASLLTSLKASIDLNGEYENHTTSGGIILKSPDGTRYRITVANGGAISAAAV